MNNAIVRIGSAAVAAAALVVIGIVLLTGSDTGAQLSPSASQAQTQQNAPPAASATAGKLDTSFGGDGKVVTSLTRRSDWASALANTPFGNAKVVTSLTRESDWASALAIQADGKIVIAGGGVARYSSDGTLDTSFSGDGNVMTGIYGVTGFVCSAVAIQTDGKIVVVGGTGFNKSSFALARYDGDGTLDSSFGAHGRLRTAFGTRGWAAASGVAIQADGKIVVVGSTLSRFALARYTGDGILDATFGRNGKVETDFTGSSDGAAGVAIQSDGKIVVVGTGGNRFALARYDSDGTLDASFGVDGKVRTGFSARGWAEASGVAIQADGKIVAVGAAGAGVYSGHSRFALARYNGDGKLDATFGVNGKVRTSFSVQGATSVRILAGAAASGVAIQADGKIVVAGSNWRRTTPVFRDSRFALARYNSDGTLDATFGRKGKVETDFTGRGHDASGVAIQADGKIVAAGTANEDGFRSGVRSRVKVALARYLGQ